MDELRDICKELTSVGTALVGGGGELAQLRARLAAVRLRLEGQPASAHLGRLEHLFAQEVRSGVYDAAFVTAQMDQALAVARKVLATGTPTSDGALRHQAPYLWDRLTIVGLAAAR